jgi:hypothetical protein
MGFLWPLPRNLTIFHVVVLGLVAWASNILFFFPQLFFSHRLFLFPGLQAWLEWHVNLAQSTVGRLAWPLCMLTHLTIL